jgi:hypothetical protein
MTSLSHCPTVLPPELTSLLEIFGRTWGESALRPQPTTEVVAQWSNLLAEWIAADDIPIFVRKSSDNRGSVVVHESGRSIIPCDNSPAHWAYIKALREECPSLDEVRALLANDAIPVAMIQKAKEKPCARYHCTRPKNFNVNEFGWKLAHIEGVGLKNCTLLSSFPFERLASHFRLLMSPANMFVVPLAWAGIAEIEVVIHEIASSK